MIFYSVWQLKRKLTAKLAITINFSTKWTIKYFKILTCNDILFNVDPEKEINYKLDHYNYFQYKVDRQIFFSIPTWNDILFNVDPEKEINYEVDHSNEFQYKVDRQILFFNSNLKYFIQCGPWKGNKLQSGPLKWISVQSGPPNIF